MIKQAIILAGGLGTRLRSVVAELPKCMAPVAGKPFLQYVITALIDEGIENFILSVGYKSESIISFIRERFPVPAGMSIDFRFSEEEEPLGTGGAVKLACEKSAATEVLVCNGDTLFKINLDTLSNFHARHPSECTLCLKPMKNFDRYGVVEIDDDGFINSFKEKQYYKTGLINGGIYALNVDGFMKKDFPQKFSFEKDYLEKYQGKNNLYGVVQDGYFIDIGIPEDYERAQTELPGL